MGGQVGERVRCVCVRCVCVGGGSREGGGGEMGVSFRYAASTFWNLLSIKHKRSRNVRLIPHWMYGDRRGASPRCAEPVKAVGVAPQWQWGPS